MNQKKALQVVALKDGTVIDHIPPHRLFDVVALLQLDREEAPVVIGNNFESRRLGKKGIVKVTNRFFSEEEINRLAVISPTIKLNVVRNYEVVEKRSATLPEELHGIVRCNNPMCISNNEPMCTYFHVADREAGVLKCHYCEKEQHIAHIKLVEQG